MPDSPQNHAQLPLTSSAAGCSCCSSAPSSPPAQSGAVAFTVEGLTCGHGHSVQTVEKAVSALEGVESATVELVPGGRSHLVIGGQATPAAVREAVTSAGYTLNS